MNTREETKGVIFDVDGTLVDSTDEHARAFVDAFSIFEHTIPYHRIRPLIGMGSEKLIPLAVGRPISVSEVEDISHMKSEIFKNIYFPKVKPFPDAEAMLKKIKQHGVHLAVASSANQEELEMLLSVVKAQTLFDVVTSSDDADRSKPDPDIVCAAKEKLALPPETLWMIGDTPYDVEAAKRAGLKAIALRCSGWQDDSFSAADMILDGPWSLNAAFPAIFHLKEIPTRASKMKGNENDSQTESRTRIGEAPGNSSRQSADRKSRARSR